MAIRRRLSVVFILLFVLGAAVGGEEGVTPKRCEIQSPDGSVKLLRTETIESCVVSLQVNTFPGIETVRPSPENALVLVEFETDFPKGPGWDLSVFFLRDEKRQDKIIPSLAFALGGKEPGARFYRTARGAGGLLLDTGVTILDNPVEAPGQLCFDLGQDGGNLWPGGKASVQLVFEVPKDAGPLEFLKAQKLTSPIPARDSVAVMTESKESSVPSDFAVHPKWPSSSGELAGSCEVRVTNPNAFTVRAGLRCNGRGKDFVIPANERRSVGVPDGAYEVYFQYSSEPEALYKGDSFSLKGNGAEIRIVKVVDGNYTIREVK